jgi:hypothetical protein
LAAAWEKKSSTSKKKAKIMHLNDGTPAKTGDIVKHKTSGLVGLIIGGSEGSNTCNLTLLTFFDACTCYGNDAIAGSINDASGKPIERCAVGIQKSTCQTASEFERIGHSDVGNG